jgi:hypothetical protein
MTFNIPLLKELTVHQEGLDQFVIFSDFTTLLKSKRRKVY